jgi:hypothetical protein
MIEWGMGNEFVSNTFRSCMVYARFDEREFCRRDAAESSSDDV